MGLYITTSKSSDERSLSLCRSLSAILPNSIFERRGKKTIEGLVARARLLGKSRALIISNSELHFLKISADSWEWLEPIITVEKAEFAKLPEESPREMKVEGPAAGIWQPLLNLQEPEGDDFITAKCGENSISFHLKGKKLWEMRHSYGSKHQD